MTDDDFERLWHRHHQRVHAYALRRTDAATAQDIVAETFLVAWRRPVPRHELAWLLGVARGQLANHARGARRRDALATAAAAVLPAAGGPVGEDHDLLRALAELSPPDREALLLTAWDGLSGRDAARVAGCSHAAFRVRLVRARRRLAVRLGRDQPGFRESEVPS